MATDDYKNVRISFWNRIKTELNTDGYDVTSEGQVRYEGLDFNTDAQTKWFEPKILAGNGLPHRSGLRNESWLFQIDCYTKTGPSDATPVSIWDLVGDIRDMFDQQTFALADWDAVGDPTVGYIVCGPMEAAVIPTGEDHLMRVSCTIPARVNQ